MIENEVEGILIPMNSQTHLAETVLQMLADPDARYRFGRAARKRALLYDQRLTLSLLSELLKA